MNEYQHPAAVFAVLPALRQDYESVVGRPFQHFFCPILHKDEPVRLCMGHVVNKALPNSCRAAVPQREDVDNFFGHFVEADFTQNIRIRTTTADELLADPAIAKTLACAVGGEEWDIYPDRGMKSDHHTRMMLHFEEGEPLPFVLKKTPAEIEAAMDKSVDFTVGKDCRLPAVVSLIKAAYLTLFKLLGYSYALSPDGRRIGHHLLGRLFRDHTSSKPSEARADAARIFGPYANMMRPIEGFTGRAPFGTVQDGRAKLCVTSSGTYFGLIVCVRADTCFFDVLMPYFDDSQGEAAFDEFLRNDDQILLVRNCSAENMRLLAGEKSRELTWPKNDAAFNFD